LLLRYIAADDIYEFVGSLGRTEDVRFSPSNSRVALACFDRNQVAIFDLCIHDSKHGTKITITGLSTISSDHLRAPHGLDFIDDSKIIVANRDGDITVFELPRAGGDRNRYQLDPIVILPSDDVMHSPGAVSVTRMDRENYEVLICNNYGNRVTRHVLHCSEDGCYFEGSEVLLSKWLGFPDGVSCNETWVAITNLNGSNVLLYDGSTPLNERSDPDGILRYLYRPHGVRFTSDGRFILVADYQGPYVHIYLRDELGWRGVRSPFKSIRVVSDDDLLRAPPQQGGVKGIDIDRSMRTLVTTCKVQPLAFFDVAATLQEGSFAQSNFTSPEQMTLQLKYELDRQDEARRAVDELTNRLSWRITAPLRWGLSLLRGNE
jgi:hypothetical protein